MTWIEVCLTILFAVFLATVAIALYYFGLFEDVQVKVGPSPVPFTGQTVAYKLARGPYNKSGHLFTKLTGDLVEIEPDPANAETDLTTMGFYYDDVEVTTDESKLRYAIGVILPEGNNDRKNALQEGLASRGYLFTILPKIDNVVYTCFPFKSTISILIAVRRVYPVIRAFVAKHNLCAHPALEVYDQDFIHFILPLSKQDSFYLFEDSSDDEDDGNDDEGTEEASDADEENSESDRASNSEAEHEGSPTKRRKKSSTQMTEDVGKLKPTISRTSTSSFEEISSASAN